MSSKSIAAKLPSAILSIQLMISSLLCKQLFMGAVLLYALFFKNKNTVHALYGRKTVGNHNAGPVFHQPFYCLLHDFLQLGIQRRCRVASSRSRTGTFFKKALAIAIRCLCPPESSVLRSPTRFSRPSGILSINSVR